MPRRTSVSTPPAAAGPAEVRPAPAGDRRRFRPVIGAFVSIFAVAVIGVAAAGDHDALWKVVHGLCVFDQTHLRSPAPCASVDLKDGEEQGTAILKDLLGRTQFLLIPTRRVTGIEDPLVGEGELPNYWAAAWAARGLVATNAQKDLSRDDIGMAINGAGSRSQSQLHIHIDCVQPQLRRILATQSARITTHWTDFRMLGQNYRVRRIDGKEPDPDPFRLLADDKATPLAESSLAVIGATFAGGKPGFVLIAQKAPGGGVHLEDLLDHSCALASG